MFHQPAETGLREPRTAIVLSKEQASDPEPVALSANRTYEQRRKA